MLVGRKSGRVRVLLDSGSQRSFVTVKVARELDCTVLREEALSVGTFGQRALKAEMREAVRLDLKSLRGSKVVSVEAYVVFQWMFEKDRILRGNPGEPVAIETVLG